MFGLVRKFLNSKVALYTWGLIVTGTLSIKRRFISLTRRSFPLSDVKANHIINGV